ncbi:MAG: hypothetical protein ABIS50_02290 [Luteolibacter sp.]|uniref:hypothetical protein n=1 Tax=Luteolibacter sp. TaxID=1962973 RepID=UPI003267C953
MMTKIQSIQLQANQKYTLYHCSDFAISQRAEIAVSSLLDEPLFMPAYVGASRGKHRLGTFKRFRKRGEFHLDVKIHSTLIVPDWGNPQVDHEAYGNFACSATLNIAASVEEIRELVSKNINPHFTAHDTLLSFPKAWNEMPDQLGIPVFPDAPTDHAVIERVREKANSSPS